LALEKYTVNTSVIIVAREFEPIHNLLCKNVNFIWNARYQKAFEKQVSGLDRQEFLGRLGPAKEPPENMSLDTV